MLIHVGERECLLDDSRRLAEVALAAGVDVELVVAVEMVHHWHLFGAAVPESVQAIDDLAAWIAGHTSA